MKKLALLVVFLGFLAPACTDECGDIKKYYATIKNITATAVNLTTTNLNPYNSSEDTLFYRDAGFLLYIEQETFSRAALLGFPGFHQTAWACSPLDPIPVELITNLEITAAENFSYNTLSFQQGDDISGLFKVLPQANNEQSVMQFVASNFLNVYSDNPFFILTLNQAPNGPSKLLFNAKVTLSDERTFLLESLDIRVKPSV